MRDQTRSLWRSWTRKIQPSARPGKTGRPSWHRLTVESLECRTLLTGNASGTISGLAYIDANGNGVRESGERLLPGIVANVLGSTTTGAAVDINTTTDAQGAFSFANLLPGSYQLTVSPDDSLVNPTTIVIGGLNLAGGQTISREVGFGGIAAPAVSLRQFLTSTSTSDFPFSAPGSGQTLVNPRENSTPTVRAPIADVAVGKNSANTVLDMAASFDDPDITNSTVRLQLDDTRAVNIELFDKQAPQTVANFFNYVQDGKYNNTVFHRLVSNFVLQGGGFNYVASSSTLTKVPADPAVKNEFGVSNLRGTVAMAKLGGDPNSATSEFFFNLADNSSNLDNQNGGFTVFGRLASEADQAVVDQLALTQVQDRSAVNSAFGSIPLVNYTGTNFPTDTTAANFIGIKQASITKRDEMLTYSVVSNSNTGLVTTSFNHNRLTLRYATGGTGSATITIRATDRFGATVDSTFTVAVSNGAPTATVAIAPTSPTTNTLLTATATATDPNGDAVTLSYVWKVNGTVVKTTASTSSLTDTLDLSAAGNGSKGDVVTVEATPSDASLTGAMATSSVTIGDTLPVAGAVTLAPTSPKTNDLLTASASVSDADGDPFTVTYVWEVNGTVVKTTTDTTSLTDTLDLSQTGNGSVSDSVRVTATPKSGTSTGTAASASVVIANSSPVAGTIASQSFSGPGQLSLDAASAFSDPDGQALAYTAVLDDGNNTLLPGWLSISPAGVLSGNPGEEDAGTLSIKVTARDPGDLTASASFQLTTSNAPTSLNDLPAVTSVLLAPGSPTPTSTLTANITANDGDGDAMTFVYSWKLNDTVVKTTTATSSLSDTLDLSTVGPAVTGDRITIDVTPNDGKGDGTVGSTFVLVA